MQIPISFGYRFGSTPRISGQKSLSEKVLHAPSHRQSKSQRAANVGSGKDLEKMSEVWAMAGQVGESAAIAGMTY